MTAKEKFQAFSNKLLRKHLEHEKHEPMQKIKEPSSIPTVACNISQGHMELEKLFGCRRYRDAHTALARRSVGRVAAVLEGHTTILN
jgi:hypothetical protein